MKTTELHKIRKMVKENIGSDASAMERNHEIQMARADCYFATKHSIQVHQMLDHMVNGKNIEPWIQEKIALAADYLRAVKEHLEYAMVDDGGPPELDIPDDALLAMEGIEQDKQARDEIYRQNVLKVNQRAHNPTDAQKAAKQAWVNKAAKAITSKMPSLTDEDASCGASSSGGMATVAAPLFKKKVKRVVTGGKK